MGLCASSARAPQPTFLQLISLLACVLVWLKHKRSRLWRQVHPALRVLQSVVGLGVKQALPH